MKNLETLIQELCPDGVEFVKLGDVCKSLSKGTLKTTDLVEQGEFPVINSGRELYGYYNQYNNEGNAITVAARGEYAGFITYMKNPFWAGGLCYPYRTINENLMVTKFLFYVLKKEEKKNMEKLVVRGSIPALNKSSFDRVEIPLPPIEVQTEIVHILDKLTSLEAEQEAELEAEQDCRKRQYEYYRDKLLSFDNVGDQEVEWKKMSEVGTFIRGKRFVRTDIVEEGVPCIHYGDIYTYYGLTATKAKTYLKPEKAEKMKFASKNDVVIVGAGENNMDIGGGVAWLSDEEVAIHDACYIFKSKMNPRFVSHYLRGSNYHLQIKKYVCEGKICSISSKSIGRSLIPVPSLSEQERIANILDRFEALSTSLQSGLPAEIAARRQQYEHYRDKLLTFKRKGAA